jgi:hypothetical protein
MNTLRTCASVSESGLSGRSRRAPRKPWAPVMRPTLKRAEASVELFRSVDSSSATGLLAAASVPWFRELKRLDQAAGHELTG